MKKRMGRLCALALAGIMIIQPMQPKVMVQAAGIADAFGVPQADAAGTIGATVPYTRYDSGEARLGGGSSLAVSADWDEHNLASQASEQSYVLLPQSGSYAEWTMHTTGAGVTMRFTMPDSGDGMGFNGSLDVYVNGRKVKTVDLTSYYMWQYFAGGNPSDTDDGGAPCFAFDEVHFLLDAPLKQGDVLRIQSSGASGLEYGVDFMEVEEVADPIEQPANSVNVEEFGAVPDDGGDDYNAIYAAIEYADSHGMDVYIPEGTFAINQTWRLYGSDMKITGAGMWYTNIQFTNPNRGSGGISGGWQTSGPKDGYCKNIEFCNMYINSNLRSRYNQEAVYKCFMDVFTDGSVIHDIWEEHFECGFWFGDYNGKMDYSDGVKVINCRIRNNLADGVNFCQGTSNAVVYNCSVRNNGDDGLACWNNTYGNAKDESGNIFAYNTIEFIWRAGGIAIYGGNGHRIYNNYICDTFMAAGIHLNTTFDGYKFTNNQGMYFDNNILVRCGTSSDSWNEELGAVDVKQSVENVTFTNTYIYDAQHEGVRILDNASSGIVFNNTRIFGAGVDSRRANYSSVYHEGAAVRAGGEGAAFNGLEIANVAWQGENAPYFITGGVHPTFNNVTIYDSDTTYEIPAYPTPDNSSQGGGVVDPLEGITGYDLQVVGLTWANESGSTDLKNGDKTIFSTAIRNTSGVDIPEGVAIGVKVTVDGKGSYTNTSYKGGLRAGETIRLDCNNTWTAVKGGHEIAAHVDYQNKLNHEISEDNNERTKNINVKEGGNTASYTRVTGGYDLYVTDVSYGQDTIAENDNLTFSATVVNAGDRDIPAGTTIGVQFQVDGQTSAITWCDSYNKGLKAGESVKLVANGGTNGNTWRATAGIHTITAWVDDVNRLAGEVNETNNQTSISIAVPFGGITYFDHPDGADDISDLNHITTKAPDWDGNPGGNEPDEPDEPQQPDNPDLPVDYTPVHGGYDLYVVSVNASREDIQNGDEVAFAATVVNAGDIDIPAGTVIGVQFQVDGQTGVVTWCDSYSAGLKAGERVTLTANGGTNGSCWMAVAGTHTITAWVDDVNRLPGEVNENNNFTTSTIQVQNRTEQEGGEATVPETKDGYDLQVVSVETDRDVICAGDAVTFTATVVNAGDTAIPAGVIIGVQFQIDGSTEMITWCDSYSGGLAAGDTVRLSANGGTNGNAWIAQAGSHALTAWVDDVNRLPEEANEGNNLTTVTINVQ